MESKGRNVIGVILAGGEGKRLRPVTYYFQKCLIPVGSQQKPLLEYIILLLKKHGITNSKLLVGYKYEQIMNYFNDGSRFGVKIDYILDDIRIGGSGGALLNAYRKGAFKNTDYLLVYYGDILSNINLSSMLKQHFDSMADATLALANNYEVPIGVAEVEGKTVKEWSEKPKINIFAGIGIAVLNQETLKILEKISAGKKKLDLMGNLIPTLIDKGHIVEAYITDNFWYDIGSTEKYEKLDNHRVDNLFKF